MAVMGAPEQWVCVLVSVSIRKQPERFGLCCSQEVRNHGMTFCCCQGYGYYLFVQNEYGDIVQ